jgi:hypothetical protein
MCGTLVQHLAHDIEEEATWHMCDECGDPHLNYECEREECLMCKDDRCCVKCCDVEFQCAAEWFGDK